MPGLTSCSALQAEFDIATDNHDRTGDRWTTVYMIAVDDRMEAFACHPCPSPEVAERIAELYRLPIAISDRLMAAAAHTRAYGRSIGVR